MTDPFLIGDMCSRIKHGINIRQTCVIVRYSYFCLLVLKKLVKGGYLTGLDLSGNSREILVYLRYGLSKSSIIRDIKILTTRRKRIIIPSRQLYKTNRGFEVLLSTEKGLLFKNEAFDKNVGGLAVLMIYC
jgi:ribosomal protein S8